MKNGSLHHASSRFYHLLLCFGKIGPSLQVSGQLRRNILLFACDDLDFTAIVSRPVQENKDTPNELVFATRHPSYFNRGNLFEPDHEQLS
mmetsp:Transcript_25818/g.57379  ORF Transcript_25818/g.57379 Transcript_25818/m.57379 type:complete len:90 (-) Transcript_25818:2931-3200(-)